MGAQSARRAAWTSRPDALAPMPGARRDGPPERSRAEARMQRRRRERHMRRLRREALQDFGLAVVLSVFTLVLTAGLGVVMLLEVPVGAAVAVSFLLERRSRTQRRAR